MCSMSFLRTASARFLRQAAHVDLLRFEMGRVPKS
jgi:hypothetical protein